MPQSRLLLLGVLALAAVGAWTFGTVQHRRLGAPPPQPPAARPAVDWLTEAEAFTQFESGNFHANAGGAHYYSAWDEDGARCYGIGQEHAGYYRRFRCDAKRSEQLLPTTATFAITPDGSITFEAGD